jgi:hypothetical protein
MAEVCISVVFQQSVATVWGVLRDFNSICSWLPGAQGGAIENGLADQIGAIRRFQLGSGGPIIREKLLALSDRDHSCSYLLLEGPLPVRNLIGEFRLYEITETGGAFGWWRARFDVAEKDRATATDQLESLYSDGWTNLKKMLGSQATPSAQDK